MLPILISCEQPYETLGAFTMKQPRFIEAGVDIDLALVDATNRYTPAPTEKEPSIKKADKPRW